MEDTFLKGDRSTVTSRLKERHCNSMKVWNDHLKFVAWCAAEFMERTFPWVIYDEFVEMTTSPDQKEVQ